VCVSETERERERERERDGADVCMFPKVWKFIVIILLNRFFYVVSHPF
jgi:hypothetical protein